MDENGEASKGKKTIMEKELMRGRDMANQLLQLLLVDKSISTSYHHNVGDDKNKNKIKEEKSTLIPLAEDLVHKVLRSFTNSLLLLNNINENDSDKVLVPAVTVKDVSFTTNGTKPKPEPEGSVDETCKSFTIKRGRGCYKRKSNAPTWEKESSILCEDGHAWRKYGQKKTMISNYLRSYYRCSHKNEQGCQATKQVQKIQDNPPLYRTTYYGYHTCTNTTLINLEDIKLEPASSFDPSTLLSFTNTNSTLPTKQKLLSPSSVSSSTKKEEPMEIIIPDHNQLHSSSNDQLQNLLCDYELYFNH